MTTLTSLIGTYGPAAVLIAALVFIVVRGEISFRYPRPPKRG